MANEKIDRKLAAILSADVVGYSLLMVDDEVATVRMLTAYRQVMIHVSKEIIFDNRRERLWQRKNKIQPKSNEADFNVDQSV